MNATSAANVRTAIGIDVPIPAFWLVSKPFSLLLGCEAAILDCGLRADGLESDVDVSGRARVRAVKFVVLVDVDGREQSEKPRKSVNEF